MATNSYCPEFGIHFSYICKNVSSYDFIMSVTLLKKFHKFLCEAAFFTSAQMNSVGFKPKWYGYANNDVTVTFILRS